MAERAGDDDAVEDGSGSATPEDVAIGGMVPPSAEAPPTVRDRRSTLRGGALVIFAAAALLLGSALVGAGDRTAAVSAVAGVGILALAVLAIVSPRLAGVLGLLAGVGLVASGLFVEPHEVPEWGRLAAGGIVFLTAAGMLAAGLNPGPAEEEPRPSVEAG
jgi:hypothetical protein